MLYYHLSHVTNLLRSNPQLWLICAGPGGSWTPSRTPRRWCSWPASLGSGWARYLCRIPEDPRSYPEKTREIIRHSSKITRVWKTPTVGRKVLCRQYAKKCIINQSIIMKIQTPAQKDFIYSSFPPSHMNLWIGSQDRRCWNSCRWEGEGNGSECIPDSWPELLGQTPDPPPPGAG